MTSLQTEELKHFLLLYASQTGQAKAIAEEIADAAPSYGLKADLYCFSLTDRRFCIENATCVVFIVSTTGDGEPPDTAVKFYRRICRHTLKKNFLENLNYTLLALGDSNYIKFCLFGRLLERRLKALSAKSFHATGYGDDSFGIETGVDPWMSSLWPALQMQLGVKSETINQVNLETSPSALEITRNITISNSSTVNMSSDKEIESLTISNLGSFLTNVDVDKCRVPKFPAPLISVTYEECEDKSCFVPDDSVLNFKSSPLSTVKLVSSERLTFGSNVKKTMELTFQFQDTAIDYVPGDSFGFICPNPENEVDLLLERLNVLHLAEKKIVLSIPNESINKRKLPAHIQSSLTLRNVFLHCVEIRSVPKKILLRTMAEYCSDVGDKQALLFLSSTEGSKAYTNCIRNPALCTLDILMQYPSCSLPVERLLEYLPYLKPRFYSVASSPLQINSKFKIVFNVLELSKGDGRMSDREGVCTGWLQKLGSELSGVESSTVDLANQMSDLTLNPSKFAISVYKRQNLHFHFPEVFDSPIIMVGPGTGVAPFVGFLQHCENLIKRKESNRKGIETWLFYGCRYEASDFLYKTELQRLKSIGVLTHLIVSFSREESTPTTRYVHESICQNAAALSAALNRGGRIYVCGDAKHMAHDVQQAFIEAYQKSCDITPDEAKSFVEKLQEQHRYVNDVWA